MKTEKITYSLSDIPRVAQRLNELLQECHIMTFTGPLGAGKTTLIKELLRQAGVKDLITSPTFAYVNEYQNEAGVNFFHFDLYRINSLEEFTGAGFHEYLYAPQSRCLIEWPAPIIPLLNQKVCHITIDYDGPDSRVMTLSQDYHE